MKKGILTLCMSFKKWRFSLLISLFVLLITTLGYAGPPFNTDDPEPVNFKHWEYYIASINTFQRNEWMGTAPHGLLVMGQR